MDILTVFQVIFLLNCPVKNETKKVYFYENHLLSGYQIYLKALEGMVTEATKKAKVPAIQVCIDYI